MRTVDTHADVVHVGGSKWQVWGGKGRIQKFDKLLNANTSEHLF